jgi:Holliday junction resolvase RusA-like endonuclease
MAGNSFRFRVPGQPPSVNHAYKIVRLKRRDGSTYQRFGKLPNVEQYQLVVKAIAHAAKPASWDPGEYLPKQGQGLVLIRYWYYVKRDIDTDNTKKAINDALKWALEIDDKRFLAQDMWKETGHKEPYVEIEVCDDQGGYRGVRDSGYVQGRRPTLE